MKPLYYESHVTVEHVPEFAIAGRRVLYEQICDLYSFKPAKLLMEKDGTESRQDSFCSSRSGEFHLLASDMHGLLFRLEAQGFKVFRYKIEAVLLDQKEQR